MKQRHYQDLAEEIKIPAKKVYDLVEELKLEEKGYGLITSKEFADWKERSIEFIPEDVMKREGTTCYLKSNFLCLGA